MAKLKILTLIAFISLSASIYADTSNDQPTHVEVIKREPSNQSRMPSDCPISAFYQNGIVFFFFSNDIGLLNISITNDFLGKNLNYCTPSETGYYEIHLPNTHGEYNFYISTTNGDLYYAILSF